MGIENSIFGKQTIGNTNIKDGDENISHSSILTPPSPKHSSFLLRKYPFPVIERGIRKSILSAVIVFLLLYVMQPFGFSLYTGNKLVVSLGFGAITFASHAFFSCVVMGFLNRFVRLWTILSVGMVLLSMILFIGLCNFFYGTLIYGIGLDISFLPTFMHWTLTFGIIITAVQIVVAYNIALRNRLNELLENNSEEQKDITITLHDQSVRGKDLVIPINSFLYAEAQKNNVMVYYEKDGAVETDEIRSTLAAIVDGLGYGNIMQCHRSFVININNITSAHGNSNGYQLTLGNCRNTVPVSRTYVPRLKAFIS